MPANIFGKMVYSFQQPMWHAITEPSTVPMTATEILEQRFEGGYEILLRPVTVNLNGEQTETGDYAVVRGKSVYDGQEVVFGYCTSRYLPLQPKDIAHSFDVNVVEPAETMAFLGKGEEMFISWKMPSFEVVADDQVDLYGIVRCGFDTLKGARLFTSAVRPVCWNTITLAEGWAREHTDHKGKGSIWKGKGVNHNLLRDLGYWMKHVQGNAIHEANLLRSFLGKLAVTPVKDDAQVKGLIAQAYPNQNDVSAYYPPELRTSKEERVAEYNAGQETIRTGIFDLFNGGGIAITPDLWGLFNSTTEYFCHVQPSKKPIAESVMFGGRQQKMMQMVDVLAKEVG